MAEAAPEKTAIELMQEGLEEITSSALETTVTKEDDVKDTTPSPMEEQARKMGWRPKEELGDTFDSSKFIEAGEFIRRQELFDKIDHEVKARQKIAQELKDVTKYVKQLTESEFNRELARKRAERQLAIEQEDIDTAEKLNDEIADLKATKVAQDKQNEETNTAEQQEQIKAHNQEVLGNWIVKNPWFNSDVDLREMADDYAEQFSLKSPDKTLEELLVYVDAKMSKQLKRNKEAAVEEEVEKEEKKVPMSKVAQSKATTTARKAAKPKATRSDLNQSQLHILTTWILPNKILNEEEYIQSLVDMGEVAID